MLGRTCRSSKVDPSTESAAWSGAGVYVSEYGGVMAALFVAVLTYCRAFFISRHSLGLWVAALRQQLVVFRRKQARPRLCAPDRAFWVAPHRLWPGWVNALIIVKPGTVVSWHRAGFRLFWRLRSRSRRMGRPNVSLEVRDLIRRMKSENPSWGTSHPRRAATTTRN